MKTARTLLLIVPLAAALLPAQTTPNVGETSLALDIGFGVRAVPPSRVTVPPGERLRLLAPPLGENSIFVWTKNGRAIASGSSNTLVLENVRPADAGTYAWEYSTPDTLPRPSQQLILGVGPTDRLLNLSTRGIAGPGGDQAVIVGFVVAAGGGGKRLILRAVGPSLAGFGVVNPLRAPVLRIFDANGQPYTNGYVYPPVVGGLTYEEDLAASLARTGAFPIPAGTRDVVVMMPFLPGSYTAHATSGDGTTGAVLVEVYEVP
ncbi:MAG: immunoglobulin domain-containing protein [Opitutaceae bacterium]|nr:immunoglobulin domain-containing protein [Opitutaceae bacterium]